MPSEIPPKILTSIVRTRFYAIIDWKRCLGLEPSILTRELREVIKCITANEAAGLTVDQKARLTHEILQEVHELGHDELTELCARLNPKVSLPTLLLNWVNDSLGRLCEWKERKPDTSSPT